MNTEAIDEILKAFGLTNAMVQPFGNGLINRTWQVQTPTGNYVLQKINDDVFKKQQDIAYNIQSIGKYLQQKFPGYFSVSPLTTTDGREIVFCEEKGWFRLMPFVENSFAFDTVQTPEQAYEAAKQFGKFTKTLSGFDAGKLKITIPHFHDLGLRYQQFLKAIAEGNSKRVGESQDIISNLLEQKNIVLAYRSITQNPEFKKRVTHHDTKISNVLFDENKKGICVIDLDTAMSGYFFSDVGDMMRTYLSPVSEEEMDLDKISVRSDFYNAIVEGYCDQMNDELTTVEKEHFFFAGKFMIYMQALRFLTDHLNDDVYYGAKYEGHNLMRAKNQLRLLECLIQMKCIKQN